MQTHKSPMLSTAVIAIIAGVFACLGSANIAVAAWTEPTAAPPGGNISAPLNVDTSFSGDISGKYNNISLTPPAGCASGQLLSFTGADWACVPGTGQWSATGTRIYYNAGNVGIGTNDPSYKLDVRGAIRNTYGGSYDVWIQGGASSTGDGRNLAVLGSNDILYLNFAGEYKGGTIIGTSTQINGYLKVISGLTGADPIPRLIFNDYYDNLGNASISHLQLYSGYGFGISSKSLNYFANRYHQFFTNQDTSTPGITIDAVLPAVIFGGSASGEYIKSQRAAGTNQYGLDLYTGSYPRLSIRNNGQVGIGTTSPTNPLHVYSTIDPLKIENITANGFTQMVMRGTGRQYQIGVGNASAGYSVANRFYVYDQASDTMRFIIDEKGNVGIGAAPTEKFDVNGMIRARNAIYSTGTLTLQGGRNNSDGNTGYVEIRPSSTWGLVIRQKNNASGRYGHIIQDDNGLNFASNQATADLTINDSGFVGIGTTTPGQRLTVNGTIWSTGDVCLSSGTCLASAGGVWIATGTNIYRIGGNVGIGTSSPAAKLHIVGDVKINSTNVLELGAGLDKQTDAGKIRYGGWDEALNLVGYADAGTLNKRVVKIYDNLAIGYDVVTGTLAGGQAIFSGNVGIGTSTPQAKLEIKGANNALNLLVGSASGKIGFISYSDNINYIESSNGSWTGSQLLYFTGYGAHTSTFAFNGNVGIGITTPNRSLHVYQTTGDNAEIDIQSEAGANKQWAIYQDRPTKQLRFWYNTDPAYGDTNNLNLNGLSGQVAIGTTTFTSGARLTVAGKIDTDSVFLKRNLVSSLVEGSSCTREGEIVYNRATSTYNITAPVGMTKVTLPAIKDNSDVNALFGGDQLTGSTGLPNEAGADRIWKWTGTSWQFAWYVGSAQCIQYVEPGCPWGIFFTGNTYSNMTLSEGDVIYIEVKAGHPTADIQLNLDGGSYYGCLFDSASASKRWKKLDQASQGKLSGDFQTWIQNNDHMYAANPYGYVSIGTTTSDGSKLNVVGRIHAVSNVNGQGTVWVENNNGNGWGIYSNSINNYFSGKVGIGTTSPAKTLSVTGDILATNSICAGTNCITSGSGNTFINGGGEYNYIPRFSNSNSLTTSSIYETGGRIGIGTVSPWSKLDVLVNSSSSPVFTIALINAYNGNSGGYGTMLKFQNNSAISPVGETYKFAAIAGFAETNWSNRTGLKFLTQAGTNNGAGIPNAWPTEKMRITGDGRVGIGATAPAAQLHIVADGSTRAFRISGATSDQYTEMQLAGNGTEFRMGVGGSAVTDGSANKFYLWNGSHRLVVDNLGNVGIGTTDPGNKLEVVGAQLIKPDATWTTGDNAYLYLGDTGHYIKSSWNNRDVLMGYHGWDINTTNGTKMTIMENGNVGINEIDPDSKLEVAGGIHTVNNTNGEAAVWAQNTDTGGWGVYSEGQKDYFANKVGIGEPDPSMSLQVSSASLWNAPAIGGMNGAAKWAYLHIANGDHSLIWNYGNAMRFGVETSLGNDYSELARIDSEGFSNNSAQDTLVNANEGHRVSTDFIKLVHHEKLNEYPEGKECLVSQEGDIFFAKQKNDADGTVHSSHFYGCIYDTGCHCTKWVRLDN